MSHIIEVVRHVESPKTVAVVKMTQPSCTKLCFVSWQRCPLYILFHFIRAKGRHGKYLALTIPAILQSTRHKHGALCAPLAGI